jgi:hypothetical protein
MVAQSPRSRGPASSGPSQREARIEKPRREARLENNQFEWDRANLTIIKVSGDAERQNRA